MPDQNIGQALFQAERRGAKTCVVETRELRELIDEVLSLRMQLATAQTARALTETSLPGVTARQAVQP